LRPDLNSPPLELWGGVECTVNRVGERFFDQIARSGHDERLGDLDRFASLGMRTVRYPILWERTVPDGIDQADWSWADERLGRLRELGIRPIVGLVHHGSGPRGTSLIEPSFVDGLAAFAGAVAARYPWVDAYTPVNEPLTTSRFSGLYGHWFPHGRDDCTFARALVTQCQATVAAMAAIRRVTPAAQLVQTEDLGQVYATPALRSQAAFENDRRWLSFDLLFGRVDRQHPLWEYLIRAGVGGCDLDCFRDEPCPPDVIGINHYLTSERFLDHRQERYPVHTHGTNGWQTYADIEAVRVRADGVAGPEALLWQSWERYRSPMAVTETHLGCTREEQLRWFAAVWSAAERVRVGGADIRAVTLWSLLGAFDWASLLTQDDGLYEPGAFDIRAPAPRPTALATLAAELAATGSSSHPLLQAPGWWQRPDRLVYRAVNDDGDDREPPRATAERPGASPLAVVGDGVVADTVTRCCIDRAIPVVRLRESDIRRLDAIDTAELLVTRQVWAVVVALNGRAPAMLVDGSHRPRDRAATAEVVARACARAERPLLLLSSNRVFGAGDDRRRYERESVTPDDPAGHAFAAAERSVLDILSESLVVRLGPTVGGDHGELGAAAVSVAGNAGAITDDESILTPAYLPDAIDAALDLMIDLERGIWHLVSAAPVMTTSDDLARRIAMATGQDYAMLLASLQRARRAAAPWSFSVALGSERGWVLGSLDEGLRRWSWDRHRSRAELADSGTVTSASLVRAERAADQPPARSAS